MTELLRDPARGRRSAPWVVPAWADPVVAAATGVIGGPAGRYAAIGARGLAGVAAALTALGAVLLALGVWQKGHCLMKGWSTPDQFWRMCYSDLPVVHVSSPLAQRQLPWAGPVPSDQAPVSGLAMWALSRVAPSAGQGLAAQQWVFLLWTLAAVLLLAAAVLAAVALHPRRPWQAAHLAASPVLVTLALVSTDLLGVALTLAALWRWRRGHGLSAGVLLGLAFLVRPFPLAFLAGLALVAWRRGDRARVGQLVVGAALGALAVVVPLVLLEPAAVQGVRVWGSAAFGSLAVVPQLLGHPLPKGVATWLALTGWMAGLALAGWLVWRPWRRVTEVQAAALVLLVVALTAPSLSVQSGLWVLPLLALSARPWWEHLVWAFVETLHFGTTWLHIAFSTDPGRGLPPEAYALSVLLRAAAWSWVLWRVWGDVPRRQAPLTPQPRAARVAPGPAHPQDRASSTPVGSVTGSG